MTRTILTIASNRPVAGLCCVWSMAGKNNHQLALNASRERWEGHPIITFAHSSISETALTSLSCFLSGSANSWLRRTSAKRPFYAIG